MNSARKPRAMPLPAPGGSGPRARNARARSRYWEVVLRHLARPVALQPRAAVGSGSGFTLGELQVMKARFGACRLVRDERTLERSAFRAHVLVALLVHGNLRGHFDGRATEVRRGDIAFFDLARTGEFDTGDVSCLSLLVPRPLLHGGLHGLVLRESDLPGKMLSRHLQQLVMSLPATPGKAESLAESTLSVLQLCVDFAPAAVAGGEADPLRTSILAHIDANLEDPALGPDMLADKFGISRTWLYRIFAGTGGIQRCIRDKRLDAAFRALCASPERRIIDVASRLGFSSERQFQRAFQQRFGSSPSEVRDREKTGSPESGEPG